ncbi:hypothetical protein HQ305_21625 [Rhodococcus sp. BP-149]|uniref:hypothetical protein n=1 Tax=unclassified Rhodococcus (in: high G+C Gram-positive bacteria) TaxID=192944 RepID=UPI001C9B2C5B|nr:MULTISPECIES: hypothetical protein [unclassified Rhodococcus (in: high G+C Gram-positive bacteria)]MBY6685256.1 hypothetical protein [Rhodococcus sp. BP-288]MBY6696294.1 hypothetical protein [Rhodococcus sp. BP-188]MBY6698158.1 hypothetical protein [Rhodococcus sp. BP-285]MBY6705088.1 hypothetical protein [Rhodococcus sp. BP-283]MBY6713027.1 hypothetical protein [Rhodococcus sp. BP-160]
MSDVEQLITSKDAAERCAAACRDFSDGISDVAKFIHSSNHGGGFGTLPSGLALARKYSELAVGGPGSLSTLLQAHIAIASSLADTFTEMGRNYESIDSEAAQSITPR